MYKILEYEKKFKLSKENFQKLHSKSIERYGIIQWYIKTDEFKEERYRLKIKKINSSYHYEWIKTTKIIVSKSKRNEIEESISFNDIQVSKLQKYPCVAKIRYVFSDDPEIVIDEYILKDSINYKKDVDYILEIEEKKQKINLNDYLNDFFNMKFIELENEYKNSNLAGKSLRDIEFMKSHVENKLLGDILLFMPMGLTLSNNLNNPKKNEYSEIIEKLKNNNFNDYISYKDKLVSLSPETATLINLLDMGFNVKSIYSYISRPFLEDLGNTKDFNEFNAKEKNKINLEFFEKFLNDEKKKKCTFSYLFFEKICKSAFKILDINFITNEFNAKNELSKNEIFSKTWKELDKLFELSKNTNQNILIDIAPGIKLIGIIISLYALFNKKEFYYKHETGNIMKFPEFSIDWDYQYLDEIYSIIKNDINHIYQFLPKKIQSLYYLKDNKLKSFFPFDSILKEYEEKRDVPFGYGEEYINLIDNKDLKKYLKYGISKVWTHMWIGDLIPETVEHSQRHSKRLMEITVKFINVMDEKSFLPKIDLLDEYINGISYKDLFYFLFGVSLNVHDLGHTYPKFKNSNNKEYLIKDFPQFIRDLHNLLTLNLIEDKNFDILAQEKAFDKSSKTLTALFKEKTAEVIESIKLICKYHRGYIINTFEINVVPLEKVLNESIIIKDKILKDIIIHATKWIKFIDGTDVQNDRIVTKTFHEFKKKKTIFDLSLIIDDFLKNTTSIFTEDIEKIKKYLKEKNFEKIDNISKNIENEDSDIKELSDVSKIIFKARQFNHFDKHFTINTIIPTWIKWNSENNDMILHLKLIKNPESTLSTKPIEKDIKEELENANIFIDNKKLTLKFE